MRTKQQQAAVEAVERLDQRGFHEVMGWLCSSHPEAVLAAIEGLGRHRQVVATLTRTEPPAS